MPFMISEAPVAGRRSVSARQDQRPLDPSMAVSMNFWGALCWCPLITRASIFGSLFRASDFWKLPHSSLH